MLDRDPGIRHVAMVHCETTTGILNPIEAVGGIAAAHGCVFIVDAMSSFGAVPIDFRKASIDYLISSANKCLEGVPGFSFVIARKSRLLEAEGRARSLSLDLFDQWKSFEKNGQFRFTPPTHALLAFSQALTEWEEEGGIAGRGARYAGNHAILLKGMHSIGLEPVLRPELQSFIITAFGYPDDEAFLFTNFYRLLSDNGMIVYPGKLTQRNTFRIGTIGRLFPADIVQLLDAIRNSLSFLGCRIPVKQARSVTI
jgi:2-aminoethylphosphonate-pyruvate transaminase